MEGGFSISFCPVLVDPISTSLFNSSPLVPATSTLTPVADTTSFSEVRKLEGAKIFPERSSHNLENLSLFISSCSQTTPQTLHQQLRLFQSIFASSEFCLLRTLQIPPSPLQALHKHSPLGAGPLVGVHNMMNTKSIPETVGTPKSVVATGIYSLKISAYPSQTPTKSTRQHMSLSRAQDLLDSTLLASEVSRRVVSSTSCSGRGILDELD
ncbi:hypothetical protein VKT23_004626 [Stygiomarasmius scandens]|uniref:Uncharacterized protein n=1 Tax=Marasmiellus scandens TaxID=2682957 RepID=A0ABR1JWJ3_9AGAR